MLVRFVAQGAQSAASLATSNDSSDSYTGDDARHYLHEWDQALGCCWEAAQESEHLKASLTASQTALVTMEGETSVA